jgi:hypothetical protein
MHLLKMRTARAAMAAERAVLTADLAMMIPSPDGGQLAMAAWPNKQINLFSILYRAGLPPILSKR